ncbi:hypothetical protein [Shinella sp.]|uniref:hypothetical protein n=1 Tax=Shinella sp. TaxID=1870904 RepID=UPI00289B3FA7|nr:hypothetical protein [Shinella sp.]
MQHTWQRDEAERHIGDVLDAARTHGSQTVIDRQGGSFEITFKQPKASLEELFSKPGPLLDDDLKP